MGKTIVTAAIAALARLAGKQVAVVKPAQTGLHPGEPGDLDEVRRLSAVADTHELARFPSALSPEAAARDAGVPPLDLYEAAHAVACLRAGRDLVLVEGAGGLLVRYEPDGATLADLARLLSAPVLVVTSAGLGTLNHTALTLEALAARDLPLAGLVIGCWPREPGTAELSNLVDLESIAGRPLSGALPAGAGGLGPTAFSRLARDGLAPDLGGRFDPAVFQERHRPLRQHVQVGQTHISVKEPT